MIKRESYMTNIRPFFHTDVIKVVTGIRRCGKSVMLNMIKDELLDNGVREEQVLYINLETRQDEGYLSQDALYNSVKKIHQDTGKRPYLFIDEVQELKNWEKVINACMIEFETDIYITGSNANLLSGELATYLGGRYVEFKVYPFSFQEVLQSTAGQSQHEVFQTYLTRGGMPFIYQAQLSQENAMQYLSDIYNTVVLKDVILRNNIRNVHLFKKVLSFFLANMGNTFSANSIRKYLINENRKVSLETIYNFIDYSMSACFLHMVQRQDMKKKEILKTLEKIYLVDHGFREALYGNNLRDINQTLENIVFMELLRRGYDVKVGNQNNREIDFIANKTNETVYIQVTYLLAEESTIDREFSVLEDIRDNYPKYVVSMDEIDRSRNGITHVSIQKFLLMDRY